MGSNPELCRTLADEKRVIAIPQVRLSSKQELADVIIFLQEVERGKSVPNKGPVVTVDRCQFGPHVIGVMAEQTLHMAIRDPIAPQLRGWEILDNEASSFLIAEFNRESNGVHSTQSPA